MVHQVRTGESELCILPAAESGSWGLAPWEAAATREVPEVTLPRAQLGLGCVHMHGNPGFPAVAAVPAAAPHTTREAAERRVEFTEL